MSSPEIWVRQFLRSPANDIDSVVTPEFMAQNFTDYFGTWLQQGQNAGIFTFDELVRQFLSVPGISTETFAVADGCFINYEEGKMPWFNNHLRFVVTVFPNAGVFEPWTFLIVGSKHLTDSTAFLQVASWDNIHGNTGTNEFKFYQKDDVQPGGADPDGTLGWIYHGKSSDAFLEATDYLGPFNGHVNGAIIMKELIANWYHWISPIFTAENMLQCLSQSELATLSQAPYLNSGQGLFSAVDTANVLQPIVQEGVSKWFNQRRLNDFQLNSTPVKIQRWMAHYLLTTTVNIQTATPIQTQTGSSSYNAPADHFFNSQLQSAPGIPSFSVPFLKFSLTNYQTACAVLDLVLIQEYDPKESYPTMDQFQMLTLPEGTLGGGKQTDMFTQTSFVLMQSGEGGVTDQGDGFPFVALQASYEDSQGVITAQPQHPTAAHPALLSEATFCAIYMLDFWNPVYSWRRGVLMQYVPETTVWNATSKQFDLDATFVGNIKQSKYATDPASPEYAFLQLLDTPVGEMQEQISNYLKKVQQRLGSADGLTDYLKLAECRKRIYRPLPLDEFGYTLPYARNYNVTGLIEMAPDGTIQTMEARGVAFLTQWTGPLSGYNPQIIPTGPSAPADTAPHPLSKRSKSSGCPFARGRSGGRSGGAQVLRDFSKAPQRLISANPTWDNNISKLFSAPYWIPSASRVAVGLGWIDAMDEYGVGCHLDKYEDVSVPRTAVTIHQHLRSKSMPLTQDPNEYFPDEALEEFRTWANQGFRKTLQDPVVPSNLIPEPVDPPVSLRIRKDIANLTPTELQTYRAKMDDILGVGVLRSIWQELGLLHAEWCLHYQEATFLWYRAYLLYVESLIDFPIPYWNGFATAASDPTNPFAGIPQVFLDETYVHPSGETRPNPLKYALALDGKSKSTTPPTKYVTRDPVLVEGKSNPTWAAKVTLFKKYQQQIAESLSHSAFSVPELGGEPWANLPAFSDDQPDKPYIYRKQNFDGAFEQPHDNYHGWVGPDMADNSYTGFDPIFLSFHTNMDRILESFVGSNPHLAFSSNFPLRPFTDQATKLGYAEPRQWRYTSLGDMAKPSQCLGYMYALPASPDLVNLQEMREAQNPLAGSSSRAHKKAVQDPAPTDSVPENTARRRAPYVVFKDVMCTSDSYYIDVFGDKASDMAPDPVQNTHYIGRVTLLGMGPKGERGRCGAPEQRKWRILDAECVQDETEGLNQVVVDLASGEVVDEAVWRDWKGFRGELVWVMK